METNPYAAPVSDIIIPPSDIATLAELVRGWEKYRMYFNAILLFPGIGVLALLMDRVHMPFGAAVTSAVFVAGMANAAFFLGPLTELYVRGWLLGGKSIGRGRFFLFAAGMTFSLILFALMAVSTM